MPARYPARRAAQQARLDLPLFPTTTIGSFPQTAEVRRARAALGARRDRPRPRTSRPIEGWIDDAVRWQEEIGLDVLVHGEFERNDMVKYFGEQLERLRLHPARLGAVATAAAASPRRSSGATSSRPAPMTVRWSAYAQSLTQRPMKGMLTGPVTMLQWSFVRDDLPRERSAGRSRWRSATRWRIWSGRHRA